MKLRSRAVVIAVVAVVLVLVAGAVFVYPAWSARQGQDARWVVANSATEVLDYDANRLLVTGGYEAWVLDRATGDTKRSWFAGADSRAALVPGGVVISSDTGKLAVSMGGGGQDWQKDQAKEKYTLVAVRGNVVVAAVKLEDSMSLTGFALADGAQVWTIPNLYRVGFVDPETEPMRPPGALRTTTVIPVRDNDGWRLVAAATGAVLTRTPDVPVVAGDVAVSATGVPCADLTLIGAPNPTVTWPGGAPDAECTPVWAIDDQRILLIAPRTGPKLVGGDQAMRLFSLALATGRVTELDWRGAYVDLTTSWAAKDIARSWGRYLFTRGAVYDTTTGKPRWRTDAAWLAGDTAVTTAAVSGVDRLAPGVTGESREVRLADAATGEPAGDSFVTGGPVDNAAVLDHGQALVFAGDEVALLSR
ncbi:hypothetical protein [Actinophytocola sp.]|uniref:hypothetical protein n=1 Tax=Actinophytocola sp. TaxID=1872138 RepID=UPI002ED832F8